MSEPNRTVMCWTALGPVVHQLLCTDIKFVTAIGVADLKNCSQDGLALGYLQQY